MQVEPIKMPAELINMQAEPVTGQPIRITSYETTHCAHCDRAITRRVSTNPHHISLWLHTSSQESDCGTY
jgi:hypothetical protein